MQNPLTRRLELFGVLSWDDRRFLDGLLHGRSQTSTGHEDIDREGSTSSHVRLVLGGVAYRYKTLPNGCRQIIAFMLPGDFCGLNVALLGRLSHGVGTFPRCTVVNISKDQMDDAMRRPSIARAIGCAVLVEQAVVEEWLVNVGQRSAEQRMAHLFCELHHRLTSVGLAEDGQFVWPGTQSDLADALGLSVVHVNRSLQRLRERQIITLRKHFVAVDIERLKDFAEFHADYLHLTEPPSPVSIYPV